MSIPADAQRELAEQLNQFPPFEERVPAELRSTHEQLATMQVNVTRQCNIACKHCHLDCGPARTEHMSRTDLENCLDVFVARGFSVMDITGGAPELNPDFEWFIREAASRNIPMMIRSNLIIHELEGYSHFPAVFAEVGATVIASLPHYRERNMEKQRGEGTFMPVIRGLQRLNALGYGSNPNLQLNLVFNPAGIAMPPSQATMEAEYKRRLEADYGIVFNNLFAITNNPTGRFGQALLRADKLDAYMNKLVGSFNQGTLEAMMCRSQVSVAPDGRLYDCDFNQAVGNPCNGGGSIADLLDKTRPLKRGIAFGNHCYACTAGAGSSCGGETA